MQSVLKILKIIRVDDIAMPSANSPPSFLLEVQTPEGPMAMELTQDAAVDFVEELGPLLKARFP